TAFQNHSMSSVDRFRSSSNVGMEYAFRNAASRLPCACSSVGRQTMGPPKSEGESIVTAPFPQSDALVYRHPYRQTCAALHEFRHLLKKVPCPPQHHYCGRRNSNAKPLLFWDSGLPTHFCGTRLALPGELLS